MVISRVIVRVTPFRALVTLLIITYLLSPLPLQVASARFKLISTENQAFTHPR